MMELKSWYFTFSVGHPLRDYVQKVNASSEAEARQIMFHFYGEHWAFCYGPFDDADKDNTKWANEKGKFIFNVIPRTISKGDCL